MENVYFNGFFIFIITVVDGITWHVSHTGIDTEACGQSRKIQCRSLGYIISHLGQGDVVQIDGSDNDENFYSLCNSDIINVFNKSLTFEGVDGIPKIGCQSWNEDENIIIFTNDDPTVLQTLLFRNIMFANGVLTFVNSGTEIVNVTFHNASIKSDPTQCENIWLYIHKSKWYGKSRCDQNGECFSTMANNITCNATDISIHKTEFYQTTFVVDSKLQTRILVSDVKVGNTDNEAQHLGGLYLTFSAAQADILIRNSVFTDQLHPSRVKSVTNLFEASIWLKVKILTFQESFTCFTTPENRYLSHG